jgi:peptidoglycan/LPS O-acetylase OafA/YrhL
VCYLGVLCALSGFIHLDIHPSQIAGSLFFFRNYQYAANATGIYTAHFWSLSIEEHFYLLWPVLLLRFGNRRGVWIAATGAFLCAMWRIFDLTFPNGPIGRLLPGATIGLRTLRTDARLDGLLLGCALALLLTRPAIRGFILRNVPKETPLLCGTLLVLNEQRLHALATLTNYVLISTMVASTLIVKEGLVYKWLNSRLLVGIGAISYSLYVWQQLFLLHPEGTHPLGWLGTFPYNLIAAFAVSTCSFYFLERPTARLGKRLTSIKSTLTCEHGPAAKVVST